MLLLFLFYFFFSFHKTKQITAYHQKLIWSSHWSKGDNLVIQEILPSAIVAIDAYTDTAQNHRGDNFNQRSLHEVDQREVITFFFVVMAFLRCIASCLMYMKAYWYARAKSRERTSTKDRCIKLIKGRELGEVNLQFFT